MINKLHFYNDSDIGYDNEWDEDELIIEEPKEQYEKELKEI
jgi:hypothetical protein